ncbi:phenol hydroxylase [Fusarium agapanthi]|uniref:Phenol hydroxylase n=1 Tax=Fusarium agapanthi TaxID=1803897 RepID=A0A9P5BCN1_9HYPO|nr:phenol hydroxylase [Fusarium agapanthi]
MPVFQETSNAARDQRILPSRALPVPRLSQQPDLSNVSEEHKEVVVIGAGPAGLFLTLLLARYGITEASLLCLDSKPGTLKAGQADGLQPRTLEVFQSLGIASEIISEGCHMEEVAFWNPVQSNANTNGNGSHVVGIERTSFAPDVNVPARFPFEVTIHQGRIERILEDNLHLYAGKGAIRRSHRFLEYTVDDTDAEFPIVAKYEQDLPDGSTQQGTVRTKYLIGADGARSKVRKCMGLELEGETTDHIWGVCDFVADTNFPDIRKRSAIHSDAGSVMVIPREQIATGEYLTRLYVQVAEEVDTSGDTGTDKKSADKKRRGAVTLEYIFEQARQVFAPYKIKIKEGTEPDWWAAYQIGQRMAPRFSAKTSDGVERVFIVGDACHTHSPKAGQGMNVSMMDSYNLAWKLVHKIHGLTPSSNSGTDPILETFSQERVDVARQLIEFDTQFSHMFSGRIGSADAETSGLTHEEFLRVFSDGSGFTSGCGLHYKESQLIRELGAKSNLLRGDPLLGALTPGRRLLDVEVKRYADATARHLQDEMPPTGRYYVLVFTSNDLLEKSGNSQSSLQSSVEILQKFPKGTVNLIVVHPLTSRFEWTDLPAGVKTFAEMRTYGVSKKEDVYEVLGVSKDDGVVAVLIIAEKRDSIIGSRCTTMASAQNIIKCAVLSTSRKISYSIAENSQNGSCIVLSNSFGADITLYQPVAHRLASLGYRVLSYDHPGHSQSTPVKDVDNVEMEQLISDVDELLRALHIDSIHAWVGVSLGAASGVYLACCRPKLIKNLAYCACNPASFGALGIMPLEYFDKMRAQAEADGTIANVIRQMHYGWASKEWLDEHPDQDERLKLASSTLSLDGLRAMMTLQKNKRFDMRSLVPQLLESCERIMFVKGDHDAHLNPLVDMTRDLVVKMAQEKGVKGDFKLVTVPDSGHGDEPFEVLMVGVDGILMALVCTLHVKLHPEFFHRSITINRIMESIHQPHSETYPDQNGYYGRYGELLHSPPFNQTLNKVRFGLQGRPMPIHHLENRSREVGGAQILVKREDLNHTGAHKINHCVGFALLAKAMGKTKLIAETGAGQHGVALATAAAYFGLECEIHMGGVDTEKQKSNVGRMQILGARVVAATAGQSALKEASDSAFNVYVEQREHALYAIGSAIGPHPFPLIVRDFQSVIGKEAREQFLTTTDGTLPEHVVACVAGGSNAMGMYSAFIDDTAVKLHAVEPLG